MFIDYLASGNLHLADCHVTPGQVNAGWVLILDGGLDAREVLADGEVQLPIRIHPKIQAIKRQTEFFLANDVIEFMRCQ